MLPDLRAVLAATIATVGLLMIAFGAVAAFRVAQAQHGALQADLARRTRVAGLSQPTRRPIKVIDTPGPHIAPFPPLPVQEVKDAPIASVLIDVPAPEAAAPSATPSAAPPEQPVVDSPAAEPPPAPPPSAESPPAEAAVGGPLVAPEPPTEAERATAKAEHARRLAAAKKARAARLARQRKLAARRAALARAKKLQAQQSATGFDSGFNNSGFGNGFGQQPFQGATRKSRVGTARSDAPFSPGGQQ